MRSQVLDLGWAIMQVLVMGWDGTGWHRMGAGQVRLDGMSD